MFCKQFRKSQVNTHRFQNLKSNIKLYFNESIIDEDKRLSKK